MNIGFIGTGNVGKFIVVHLIKAGHRLFVNDINIKATEDLVKSGAQFMDSPALIATKSEHIFLSLPDPDTVEQVVLGQRGILSTDRKGLLIIDLSTNSPEKVLIIGRRCKDNKCSFVDAPITGGIKGATEGTLTVMVGGSNEDVERARPLLEFFSSHIVHIGPQSHGSMAKLINNMLGEINVYAIAEAYGLGAKLGLDLNKLHSALSKGMASSRILTELYLEGAFKRNFSPSVTVNNAYKDQLLLTEMARKAEVPLVLSNIVLQRIIELRAKGLGNKHVTVAVLPIEKLLGVEIRVDVGNATI